MNILPRPKKLVENNGEFFAESGMRIVAEAEELKVNTGWALPLILKNELMRFAGIEADVTAGTAGRGDISLKLDEAFAEQAYSLHITEEKIEIIGKDRVGVGYGIQTLCQIIRSKGALLPLVNIEDKPDIPVRGFYMDQARGRSSKLETLKKQVDILSRYKINQYQLYIEQSFAFKGMSEMWREDSVITPEEIMELDKYCRDRDIDFVPSIASFGHLYELLRTKSYEDICELENAAGKPFSFIEKMQHHTVNVADERSFEVVKRMLDEYLPLFSSSLVNICADETFDLGKGRSKELADKIGTSRMYMDFLKKLCEYVVSRGKIPMFWGDIIRKFPEFIKELPKETICMAWGYLPDQKDDICKPIAEVGANLYLCPGVCGWNNLMNRLDRAYSNIKIMSGYSKKYKAVGLLNTEWGDFGHVNDPYFSIPGIIYGGVFTWNIEAYSGENSIDKEKLNREISRIEYSDRTETYVGLLEKAAIHQIYDWWACVVVCEGVAKDGSFDKNNIELSAINDEIKSRFMEIKQGLSNIEEVTAELYQIRKNLRKAAVSMDSTDRLEFAKVDNAIVGIDLWNRIGKVMLSGENVYASDKKMLAEELEIWFMKYKEIYRAYSKESMISRVAKVVFWYADRLRGI
ncbi:MAG: beta-N-acetylhexosaminidase [Catonella sp.]|uniref:beta-N-acetylhexosaminidase n=1 Tax=Catonella sp. TaxID=2382125 RepID=UPI003FA13B41